MKFHIVYGKCCRWWPLVAGGPVGKCGVCHERPVVDIDFTDADYDAWLKELLTGSSNTSAQQAL